ncbi:MAG: hypothetical protein ACFFCU_20250 [Promethearchaeota archaeon]
MSILTKEFPVENINEYVYITEYVDVTEYIYITEYTTTEIITIEETHNTDVFHTQTSIIT